MTEKKAFSEDKLYQEIMCEAKILGIPEGVAEMTATPVVKAVSSWAAERPAITENDLNRKVAEEIEKYHRDLAYVYRNRGKII